MVKFKSLGKGKYETKVVSAHHVSGPQSAGDTSTLQGQQVQLKNENCTGGNHRPDVGKFDCTSKSMKLLAFPNPQMAISRSGANLVLLGDAFLDGTLKYTGKDTIPYDAKFLKGCARYDSDITYGSEWAKPNTCVIYKQSLTGKFKLGRVK